MSYLLYVRENFSFSTNLFNLVITHFWSLICTILWHGLKYFILFYLVVSIKNKCSKSVNTKLAAAVRDLLSLHLTGSTIDLKIQKLWSVWLKFLVFNPLRSWRNSRNITRLLSHFFTFLSLLNCWSSLISLHYFSSLLVPVAASISEHWNLGI